MIQLGGKYYTGEIFGPKRNETVGGWGKPRNEGFHNFYSWPNIIGMMKSRRIKWTRHIAPMG
jgi:hypothetical protein